MATAPLRLPGLCPYDASGNSGRDAHRVGFSNYVVEFFHQHFEDASAMTTPLVFHNPEFDVYAADYDAALAQGLAVSGEDKMYFVHGRLAWLASCLYRLGEQPTTAMDYGCGIG